MSAASLTSAHRQFEAALPAITNAVRYAFRRRRPQDRAEAVAEAQAAAWSAWAGLLKTVSYTHLTLPTKRIV